MIRRLAPALLILTLAACGERAVPASDSEADAATDALASAPRPTGSSDTRVPGTGPTSFVGRWAADVSWCAAPQGERRPIEITPVRFEGYESSCHIASVDETATGYNAVLQCESEGERRTERVHMTVASDVLTLTWQDRPSTDTVELHKCTTLADIPETPAPTQ